MHEIAVVKGYTEKFIIATFDNAIVVQNTLFAVVLIKLGGFCIEGIRNDPCQICEILKISDFVHPFWGPCPVLPDDAPERKPRIPLFVVLKENNYIEASDQNLANYIKKCTVYYVNGICDRRCDNLTQQLAPMMSLESRLSCVGFSKIKWV